MKFRHLQPLVFIGLFFFMMAGISVFAQDHAARIAEIRKMYGKARQLENSGDSTACKTGTKTIYQGFDDSSEKMPFKQSCKECHYSGGYKIYAGEFSGYEWFSKSIFYFKDNKLFFLFSEGGAESCAWEYRIYYDKDGIAIKILEKSNDCTGEEPDQSKEINDPSERKRILDEANNDFNAILEMLK